MKKAFLYIKKEIGWMICMILFANIAHSQSATITVDCNVDKGVLFRSEAHNNVSGVITGAATRDADYAFMSSQGLHAKVLRMWISDGLYNSTSDTYDYSSYYSYLNSASALMADNILMCIPGNTLIDSRNYTPAQCKPIIKNIIKHFKNLYPKIKYVEALNEPDLFTGTTINSTNAYSYYKVFYEAVNEINTELNPATPLQVGGIAISSFKFAGAEWITKFLDNYRDDVSPSKKLDFISYHTYSYKESPKETNDIRPIVEGWLSSRGLPTTIPSFITETGLFPGAATSGTEEDDALRQAAGMASYTYWETNSPYNVPFNWVIRHAAEVRKDQMVTRPNIFTDRLTPYGNMMKMMGLMKTQRIGATTNVMDVNGLGVYGLASSDPTGLSIMAWNYQHIATKDYQTSININNLPAMFTGMGIRKKVYRIDQTTSNNYYNVTTANLQLISDTTLANPGTSVVLSLGILNENSIQLVVLEPVSAPSANTFSLSANRQGNSALLKWRTETETNSVYFEVFRSIDGNSFAKLGNIAAAGSSAVPVSYSFTDNSPLAGLNYYQVKLVQTDSSRIASGKVTLFMSQQETSTDIYYNFGLAAAENGNPTSGVPTGWAASVVSRGNAASSGSIFTSTSPSNAYTGFSAAGNATMGSFQGSLTGKTVTYGSVTTAIPATPLSSLSYYQVTLTPTATQAVSIKNISFGSRSIGSAGGPASVVIRTSIDNYATNISSQNINTASAWVLVNAALSTTVTGSVGVPVTIRIYANDAVGTTTNANNWRIDDLDIGVSFASALPLLNTVTATETAAHAVQVAWQTSSEQNISNFEILRSSNGTTFTSIGQVSAVGNSTSVTAYNFVDAAPLTGINYYQIKQISSTAVVTLSEIVSIYIAQGTITNIYYDFGNTASENGSPTSGVPTGWTVTNLSIGNSIKTSDFFTSISGTGTYAGASQQGNATLIANTGSLNGRTVTYGSVTTNIPTSSIISLSYFQTSLTPLATEQIKINKISFGQRSIGSSGGPANVVIRTSIDNFTSNVFTQNINANSAWELIEATFASPLTAGPGQTVVIRIYANDAVGGTANNWRIDDLNISSSNTPVILPISLISFTGQLQPNGVKLQWATASEQNNSHYEILRSGNGTDYQTVASILAFNNISVSNNYNWVDVKPLTGTSFYKLKQVDKDGKYKLYGPIIIKSARPSINLQVVAKSSSIDIHLMAEKSGKATIAIFDINGRKLVTKDIAITEGANYYSVPVTIASGIYSIQIAGNGLLITQKFFK